MALRKDEHDDAVEINMATFTHAESHDGMPTGDEPRVTVHILRGTKLELGGWKAWMFLRKRSSRRYEQGGLKSGVMRGFDRG